MIDRRRPSEGGGDSDGVAGGAPDGVAGGAYDGVIGATRLRFIDRRLVICAVVSVAGHFAFARSLGYLPARPRTEPPRVVRVRVIEPPAPEPPPETPRPPEVKPPEPVKQVIHERPQPHPPVARHDATPVEAPPVDHPPATTDTTTTPVFGVTMESTSQAGTGPAMPVGNTTRPAAAAPAATAVKPLAEPIAATEATKMPLPQGDCRGKYTDEAFAAGVEGTVVLDLIVDEHGRARDITVVSGLPHGLTAAAMAAVAACPFSPGERDGKPTPVRVRGFKIRFVLAEGQ